MNSAQTILRYQCKILDRLEHNIGKEYSIDELKALCRAGNAKDNFDHAMAGLAIKGYIRYTSCNPVRVKHSFRA